MSSAIRQFNIISLLALTAAIAPVFAIAALHDFDLMNWVLMAIPLVILCLILLRSGSRCLIGATVGAAVAVAGLVALLYVIESWPKSDASILGALVTIAYFGAAIGGGIHASSIEHRAQLKEQGSEAKGSEFSLERVAMIPCALVALVPGWFGGRLLIKLLVDHAILEGDSQIAGLLLYATAILGGVAGALLASLLFGTWSQTRSD